MTGFDMIETPAENPDVLDENTVNDLKGRVERLAAAHLRLLHAFKRTLILNDLACPLCGQTKLAHEDHLTSDGSPCELAPDPADLFNRKE